MRYRIASLVVQPILVVEDDGGQLGPLPDDRGVKPIAIGLSDIKGSPLHGRLLADVEGLNNALEKPEEASA